MTTKQNLYSIQNQKKIVEGYIDYRIGNDYSFCVLDAEKNKIQQGKINAVDGKLDEWKENIEITLKSHLKAGRYFLFLFDVAVDEQKMNSYKRKVQIDIVEK